MSLRMLCVLVLAVAASTARADFSASEVDDRLIVTDLHLDDAQVIHEWIVAFGWSPLHVDVYNVGGEVFTSSLWKKYDGVWREPFIGWNRDAVQDRLAATSGHNQLLQVDACTASSSDLGQALPGNLLLDTLFAGVWVETVPAERVLVYLPRQRLPFDVYFGPNTPVFSETHNTLWSQGFRRISQNSVTNPLGPLPNQAVVALYEKSSILTAASETVAQSNIESFVENSMSMGSGPIHIDPIEVGDLLPEAGFRVLFRQSNLQHLVFWGVRAEQLHDLHLLAAAGNLEPATIAGYEIFGEQDRLQYVVVFREVAEPRVDDRKSAGHGAGSDKLTFRDPHRSAKVSKSTTRLRSR